MSRTTKEKSQIPPDLAGNGFDSFLLAGFRGPTVEHAVAGIAGDYVKMQVLDQLAGRPPVVAQNVVTVRIHSLGDGAGNPAQTARNLTEKLGRTIMQLFKVLFRNHQGVALTQRTDIQECQNEFVFVDSCSGYLPGYNLTKNAIFRTHQKLSILATENTADLFSRRGHRAHSERHVLLLCLSLCVRCGCLYVRGGFFSFDALLAGAFLLLSLGWFILAQ